MPVSLDDIPSWKEVLLSEPGGHQSRRLTVARWWSTPDTEGVGVDVQSTNHKHIHGTVVSLMTDDQCVSEMPERRDQPY